MRSRLRERHDRIAVDDRAAAADRARARTQVAQRLQGWTVRSRRGADPRCGCSSQFRSQFGDEILVDVPVGGEAPSDRSPATAVRDQYSTELACRPDHADQRLERIEQRAVGPRLPTNGTCAGPQRPVLAQVRSTVLKAASRTPASSPSSFSDAIPAAKRAGHEDAIRLRADADGRHVAAAVTNSVKKAGSGAMSAALNAVFSISRQEVAEGRRPRARGSSPPLRRRRRARRSASGAPVERQAERVAPGARHRSLPHRLGGESAATVSRPARSRASATSSDGGQPRRRDVLGVVGGRALRHDRHRG